jgi:hypothetical protein
MYTYIHKEDLQIRLRILYDFLKKWYWILSGAPIISSQTPAGQIPSFGILMSWITEVNACASSQAEIKP